MKTAYDLIRVFYIDGKDRLVRVYEKLNMTHGIIYWILLVNSIY